MKQDLVGKVFSRLTVLRFSHSVPRRGSHWECLCSCGNTVVVLGSSLKSGNNRSCGCLHKDLMRSGNIRRKHGKTKSPEYKAWTNMLGRCENPQDGEWKNYGGRGIQVCSRWKSFVNFYKDMGDRPTNKHTLERVDNDGNYEPNNVVWALRKTQARNRRTNRIIEYDGQSKSLIEWAEDLDIPYGVLWARLFQLNWSVDRAFKEPLKCAGRMV